MPLQVNEVAIKELATLTGVEFDTLKSELFVDAATPPTETKLKDILANTVIMKKPDYTALLDNTGKSKFDEGKYKETNQIVKIALGDKAFDTQGMKREEVFEKIQTALKEKWDAESGKPTDEKIKQWNQEKESLQKTLGLKDQEIEKLKGEFAQKEVHGMKERKVLAAVSAIPFEATGEILLKQRDVVLKNIISSYDLKVEDGKDVYYKDGQKLVDAYLNPIKIDEIVKGESIIFPTVKASNGRGDDNSKNNKSGELDAELSKLNTSEDVAKFMAERGLSPLNADGKALMNKWIALKSKKA